MKNKIFFKNKFRYKNYFSIPMMPYPSGSLHIGHIRNYSINDIINRFLKLKKYNTYNFIGWDCFGTPAENVSLVKKYTPFQWISKNILYMKKQLNYIGFFNNWNKKFITCNNYYYKTSQWIFIKLLKNKLIYFDIKKVNWDPVEKTVLSNEQVINGLGWRSGAKIEFLKKKTYFINITKYKLELFNELKNLNWPKKVKFMQFNWFGKSNFIYFIFFFKEINKYKNILVKNIKNVFNIFIIFLFKNIYKILIKFKKKYNLLFIFNINKIYFNSGLFYLNPLSSKKIELWVIKKNIKIKNKLLIYNFEKKINLYNLCIFFNFKDYDYFYKKKFKKLFKNHISWKIKDWGVSRQRYWGTPIPIIICDNCGSIFDKINNFILPKNLKSNNNNLKNNIFFKNIICSKCKKISIKETDTLDTFFDSSWYFLNYLNFKRKNNIINKWFPIDFYSGGIEHSILHLLYSRFIIKFLRDKKYLNFGEPIRYLFTQGMILNKTYYKKDNGIIKWISKNDINDFNYFEGKIEKMSKSKKNGINPNDLIEIYNVNSLRLSVIYSSSLKKDFIWKEKYIIICYKFLKKFLYFCKKNKKYIIKKNFYKINKININDKKFLYYFYKKIENINSLYLNIKYNKIISVFFLLFNKIKKNKFNWFVINEVFSSIIRIIYPIIPHLSYKLWNNLLYKNELGEIFYTFWPKIYSIKLKNINKYLVFLNNKKIDFIIIEIEKFFIKKIINYFFLKKIFFKKKNINKIIVNKNIINIILKI